MKLVTLVENTACKSDLGCEHGLSLYIETGAHKILFDMGQTGLFAENAAKLGIDLKTVDFAVLSHGHYDHGGGAAQFLEINRRAPVYVNRGAFASHYNAAQKYIGLDPALQESGRLIFTEDAVSPAPGITLHGCNDRVRPYPTDAFGLTAGENREPDDFGHEQYLLIREGEKRICISGCSHKGIANIVHWFHPDILVGGFHLMKEERFDRLIETANTLLRYPTIYYTGHCTGEMQFGILKTAMGERLHRFSTGTVLEL